MITGTAKRGAFIAMLTLLLWSQNTFTSPLEAREVGYVQFAITDGLRFLFRDAVGNEYFAQIRAQRVVGIVAVRAQGQRQSLGLSAGAAPVIRACPTGQVESCWEDDVENASICQCVPNGGNAEFAWETEEGE